MNTISKMVLIPEKEYQLLKNNIKEVQEVVDKPIEPPLLDEYKKTFNKAVKEFEKRPFKKKNKQKTLPIIKWTSVKKF